MPRSPGQRAGLTHDAVLDAAHGVLTERGMAGLSMRAVAGRLGVAPNALYSHVAGKDELVDALLDDILRELELPDPHSDPRRGLTDLMTATHELLLDRVDLVPLYLARQGARGPNARALGAAMEGLLARARVADPGAAVRVLIIHAIGSAAFAGGPAGDSIGPVPVELRTSFATGLGWLLGGMGV